jgi:hypothetical protein
MQGYEVQKVFGCISGAKMRRLRLLGLRAHDTVSMITTTNYLSAICITAAPSHPETLAGPY